MSRFFLSLILFFAGILHLWRPELFDPAIPFDDKWSINVFSGLFEITLGFGLWKKKLQDISAQISALWFLLLIPIHLYVSWNHIPMFGIGHPALLWARTALQPLLYLWAISLQNNGWIMAQTWRDVLFLHYQVDPKLLQEHVPFKLDLYEGHAIISIVSFTMDSIRFPFLPSVPGLSKLNELNLRTYVEVDGVKGVYFFTLDADLRPAIWIAKSFFSLPYRLAKINISKKKNNYIIESENALSSLRINADIGAFKPSSDFDLWATERYGLFTKRFGHSLHGIVQHAPWQLSQVTLNSVEDHFSSQLGVDFKAKFFIDPRYCPLLKVRFRPFYNLR